jgi:hypothetical protein
MYTYIIESQGYYKIGKATDIDKRLASYRTHSVMFKVIKIYPVNYEKVLHHLFTNKLYKLEWFNLDENDIRNIQSTNTIDELIKLYEPEPINWEEKMEEACMQMSEVRTGTTAISGVTRQGKGDNG